MNIIFTIGQSRNGLNGYTFADKHISVDELLQLARRMIIVNQLKSGDDEYGVDPSKLSQMIYMDSDFYLYAEDTAHLIGLVGSYDQLIEKGQLLLKDNIQLRGSGLKGHFYNEVFLHVSSHGFYWTIDGVVGTRSFDLQTIVDWLDMMDVGICKECGNSLAKGFYICTCCDPEA
jgi:hypothetical protein